MEQSLEIQKYMQIALPEVLLAGFALFMLVFGAFKRVNTFLVSGRISCFFLLVMIGLVLSMFMNLHAPVHVFNGLYIQDSFSLAVKLILLVGTLFSMVFVMQDMSKTGIGRFEAPVLMILSLLGMFFMVSANNMLTLYVGLELQALALYVLATFNRHSLRAPEAGMKYFILGAIASGLLLFGISFVYGYAGSTSFAVLAGVLGEGKDVIGLIVGLAFILAGLAFKVSAVPFHMWTPDVYQGAPSSVTAFFAIVPKIAAMALIIRLLSGPFSGVEDQWQQIIYFLSVASMIVGAFAGLVQDNVKRLIAYSSIGNMGYALMGVVVLGIAGTASVFTYLVIYMFMTAGLFGVILSLRKEGIAISSFDDFKGLSRRKPFYAYTLAILLFSMSGIPPLAGFFGKLVIFKAVIDAGLFTLAVIGVLTSVVAAYYYIRLIKIMFFDEEAVDADNIKAEGSPVQFSAIAVSLAFILGFCLMPAMLIEFSGYFARHLF